MLNNEQFNVQYASDVPGTQFTTQFTCFAGTNAQILTQYASDVPGTQFTTQFTCFTGTKAQILTHKLAGSAVAAKSAVSSGCRCKILTQLLVQKHKY